MNFLRGFYCEKKLWYAAALILAAVLFFSGFYAGKRQMQKNDQNDGQLQDKEIRQTGYKFISPLLECEIGGYPLLKNSELKIKEAVQGRIIDKNPDDFISLYFRDLNNGPSFGISEQESFSPASLLKVPLMMAYYKYAENEPQILDRSVNYAGSPQQFQQAIVPGKHIEIGKNYTIEELIEAMIKYSDNEATNLLFQNISQDKLKVVFDDLGIAMPDVYDPNNAMPVKDYASFFRILYNASYLDRDMSERALDLLSTVEYKDGLIAGVPPDVAISHKFGERELTDKKGGIINQLHDCGIVYYPEHPYLLCIMTKGKNINNLSRSISSISKIVYEEVSSRNR